MNVKKASDEQILLAYSETNSVWKAADKLGMCGQVVYRRLRKIGASKPMNVFTEAEKGFLRENYEMFVSSHRFDELCQAMRRDKATICGMARKLGLTKKGRPLSRESIERSRVGMVRWHATHDHPRGMLGKKHRAETLLAVSESSRKMWARMTEEQKENMTAKITATRAARGILPPNRETASWKASWQEIGGKRRFFRSRWESNYAHYLEWLKTVGQIKEWEHEPKTFWFEGIKRGCCSYLPDFRVTENSGTQNYHEVKGWMDDRSKTKISRMAKYHPTVKLIVIDAKAYRSIAKTARGLVPGWEAEAIPPSLAKKRTK